MIRTLTTLGSTACGTRDRAKTSAPTARICRVRAPAAPAGPRCDIAVRDASSLSPAEFLTRYHGKRPVLIRGARGRQDILMAARLDAQSSPAARRVRLRRHGEDSVR